MWETREGIKMAVSEMTVSHARNSLHMMAKNYAMVCIKNGARWFHSIHVESMSDEAVYAMLTKACDNPQWFKELIMEQCFGPPLPA